MVRAQSSIALLAILLVGTVKWAHTEPAASLRCTVSDVETGVPLARVNIEIVPSANDGSPRGAPTDEKGTGLITGLPAGTYTVVVTHIGYQRLVIRDLRLSGGEIRALHVDLSPAVHELAPETVSSVSRRREKTGQAPAAVHVVTDGEVQMRTALTPAEHLRLVPAVDIINTGLNQPRLAIRGFNRTLGEPEKLLVLADHRNMRMPALRFNVWGLLPTNDDDIERLEVVSGPGAALYGPNAANGVVHVITKSPFESQGTHLSSGIGERSLFMGSFRHAGLLTSQIAYKVSGRYYQGTDWKSFDPAEPDSITRSVNTSNGRIIKGPPVVNTRDFDIANASLDGRLDFRPRPDLELVLSAGYARSTNLQMSEIGTYQGKNWTSRYLQARTVYGSLFAQAFVNQGDLGDTYLLRNGESVIDRSSLYAAQLQHATRLLDGRQNFVYGADLYLTRPETENTLHGRNEDDDDFNEIGFYLQSETQITPRLKAIGAARLDDHSRLDDRTFSPRAALVYQPNPQHNIRATYNRAFTSPSTGNLFFDLNIVPTLGPLPIALEGRGLPDTGYHFVRGDGGGIGGFFMQSPFLPEELGGRTTYLPAEAALMWDAAVGIMQLQGVDLSALPAPGPEQVGTQLTLLNTANLTFEPIAPSSVTDIRPYQPTITTTYELGYRGTVGSATYIEAGFYYSEIDDFIRFGVQTPTVMLEETSLAVYLGEFMPAEDAAALAAGMAGIPLGIVMLQELGEVEPADMILSYRNFEGGVSFYGADFNIGRQVGRRWYIEGAYSLVSEDFFKRNDRRFLDIALNAPRHKVGLKALYRDPARVWATSLRLKYVDGFPGISGVFVGDVESYWVVDLSVDWELPFSQHTRVNLSVQNLLNDEHREFVGGPGIGRLALMRIGQSF